MNATQTRTERILDADATVIGLGTMGPMVAWRIAQETNLTVLGFEQFGLGHAHGSAAGESRLFRVAYHENSAFVPLLLKARNLWLELGVKARRQILIPTGTCPSEQMTHPS